MNMNVWLYIVTKDGSHGIWYGSEIVYLCI